MKTTKLSNRKKQILLLLYRYRFLTTHHIQQFLKHKNPTRIQQWLQELTRDSYIVSDYDRSTFETNRKPAVYCLASKSKTVLEQEKSCDNKLLRRLYKEKTLSKSFKERKLFIADFYLMLSAVYVTSEKFIFLTTTDLIAYEYMPQPLPDAYLAIKKKPNSSRYFIEVLDETIKKSVLLGKVAKYFRYIGEGDWQAQTEKSFPKLLFILVP